MTDIDFLNIKKIISNNYWIPKNEIFKYLGFSRIDWFTRFLKNEKYNYGVIYSDMDNTVKISIKLLFDLVYKRLQWNDDWNKLFIEVWERYYRNKIINFTKSNQKQIQRHDRYDLYVRGKFYTYALTTKNIANENDFDTIEIYKHCVRNFIKYRDPAHFLFDNNKEPLVSFDSKIHVNRYHVLLYIKKLISDFKMDELQKTRLNIYYKVIEELLIEQYETDCKIEDQRKRQQKLLDEKMFGKDLSDDDLDQLKKLYREVSFLCHPDIIGGDGYYFKKANKLFSEKRRSKLLDLKFKLQRV